MSNHSYSTTIEVTKSPEDVFNRITEVSKWWNRDYEGRSAALHDEFIIRYSGGNYNRVRVTGVIPSRRIEWVVSDSVLTFFKDPSEWANTKMVFDIVPTGETTALHFTHEGLVPERECYAMCASGWDKVIKTCLEQFITHGTSI